MLSNHLRASALSCVGGSCYFCLIVNHAMNHANPLRVMETDVSSPAFDVIYGMLRCKFELFIISRACLMILGVSRLATVRAIVLAKHSPKRNVGADELVVRLYLSLVDRPIALAPKIVGLVIDQTIVDIHSGLIWFIG